MFDIIMKDILGQPAILVGLFAMCGLLLQKKNFADTVSGTLKTIMGFVVLGGGATILIGALDVFGKIFDKAFHIKGIIPNTIINAVSFPNVCCAIATTAS
ncbi:PTS transporter subunit IIC, partial [Bacillus sp. D-CC]